jgi:transposase
MQVCPQCQSDRLVNNGSAAGKPKKLRRQCGYHFTRPTPRGKPLAMKVHAVLLDLSGISMHRIAFLLRVSAPSVLNWLRTLAQEHYEKPEPPSRAIILELDEMWHYLKQKRRTLWIWKALDRDTGQLLDWECGRSQPPARAILHAGGQGHHGYHERGPAHQRYGPVERHQYRSGAAHHTALYFHYRVDAGPDGPRMHVCRT